ncbi:MAG: D-glycero-beta-D-manno-heptose-7-phosphate kinase [Gammaproteobacteria bacterium]
MTSHALPSGSQLANLLPGIRRARIACIGDVMLDRYVYGSVERISPEAPIPILRIEREARMLGGAGNVAGNVAGLGVEVRFLAVIGADDAGRDVRALLESLPPVEPTLLLDPGRATTEKIRYVGAGQQILRTDRETPRPVDGALLGAVDAWLDRNIPDCGVLILSDYGKGMLSQEVLARAIQAARRHERPILVDPKGTDFQRYRGCSVITPNRRELRAAVAMPVGDSGEIEAAARRLIDDIGVTAVLVTRSEEGMSLVPADGPASHIAADAREVFDVSGAGDTVVATLGCALGAGIAMLPSAMIANVAAGVAVSKFGTATVGQAELGYALRKLDADRFAEKVVSVEEARAAVDAWRSAGRSVGFTNGCFDLLHPGHVSLIRRARERCDRLVVGLNSDSSVRHLKGETRPVQNEAARAAVLAALQDVDLVVIFAEETPLELIRELKPDALFKGADYTIETVVGADIVRACGGRVELIELVPDASTTRLVSRITGTPG